MSRRAIVYLPAGAATRWLLRMCVEYCDRQGYELVCVTHDRAGVWAALQHNLVDVVVVAWAADGEQLLPVIEVARDRPNGP